jgi:hypothetical protein
LDLKLGKQKEPLMGKIKTADAKVLAECKRISEFIGPDTNVSEMLEQYEEAEKTHPNSVYLCVPSGI